VKEFSIRKLFADHNAQNATHLLAEALLDQIREASGGHFSIQAWPPDLLDAASVAMRGFVIFVTKEDVAFDRTKVVVQRAWDIAKWYSRKPENVLSLVLIECEFAEGYAQEFERDIVCRFKVTRMPVAGQTYWTSEGMRTVGKSAAQLRLESVAADVGAKITCAPSCGWELVDDGEKPSEPPRQETWRDRPPLL
jgi:hypothetical protein